MGTTTSIGSHENGSGMHVSGTNQLGGTYNTSVQHRVQQDAPQYGGYTGFTDPNYMDRMHACPGSVHYYSSTIQNSPAQVPALGVYGGPTAPVFGYPPQQPQQLYPRLEEGMYENHLQDATDDHSCEVSRDLVLARVMAAEEFLQNMWDTDRRIQVMSEVNDRSAVLHPMTEALGLRGHMQDELLRILAMLAADYPDLSCLNEFETEYPDVVNTLRDLGKKAKALRALSKSSATSDFGARSAGIDLDPELVDLDPSLRTAIEAQLQEIDNAATQTDPIHQEVNVTEGELRVKHEADMMSLDDIFLQEEQTVSSKFAERVLEAGPGSVNQLLQEHALRMQALRDRQHMEQRRVLSTGSEHPNHASQTTSQAGRMMPLQTGNQLQQIQKSYVAEINFGTDGKMSVVTPDEKTGKLSAPSGKKKSTRPVGRAAVIRQKKRSSVEKVKDEVIKSPSPSAYLDLNSEDELDDLIASATKVQNSINDDDFGGDEFNFTDCNESPVLHATVNGEPQKAETEELRSTFTKDMWEKRKDMTSEDFKTLMSDFRSQENERERMRMSEKEKHQSSMLAKIAEKRKETNSAQISQDAVETPESKARVDDMDSVDGIKPSVNADNYAGYLRDRDQEGEEAKRIRGGERQRMDQKLKDKLKNKKNTANDSVEELTADIDETMESTDAAFVEDLRRRGMSEVDIDELLRRHLQEAEQIRHRKFAERSRLDERLREILGNSNKKDLEEMDDEVVKDLKALDADLGRRVRGRRGVSVDDLDQLLREHRRRQEEILKSRAAERGRGDERLKAKLQAVKALKDGAEANEALVDDDQFFDRLQSLQKSGDLSHDAFQDMLRHYLSNVDSQRQNDAREERRRLQSEEKQRERDTQKAQQTASTLVTEHQEKTKQLQNARQRERRALDDKLKEKLKQSKMQKQAAVDPNDF